MNASQQNAAIAIIQIVADAVRESGKQGTPEGPLYAALSAKGCSIQQYGFIRDLLIESGRVRVSANVLYWVD